MGNLLLRQKLEEIETQQLIIESVYQEFEQKLVTMNEQIKVLKGETTVIRDATTIIKDSSNKIKNDIGRLDEKIVSSANKLKPVTNQVQELKNDINLISEKLSDQTKSLSNEIKGLRLYIDTEHSKTNSFIHGLARTTGELNDLLDKVYIYQQSLNSKIENLKKYVDDALDNYTKYICAHITRHIQESGQIQQDQINELKIYLKKMRREAWIRWLALISLFIGLLAGLLR